MTPSACPGCDPNGDPYLAKALGNTADDRMSSARVMSYLMKDFIRTRTAVGFCATCAAAFRSPNEKRAPSKRRRREEDPFLAILNAAQLGEEIGVHMRLLDEIEKRHGRRKRDVHGRAGVLQRAMLAELRGTVYHTKRRRKVR